LRQRKSGRKETQEEETQQEETRQKETRQKETRQKETRQKETRQKETRQQMLYSDLCDAASAGYLSAVRDLIARGADPSYKYTKRDYFSMAPAIRDRPSPMELAISGGHPKVIRYLSENGMELHEDKLQALLLNFNSPNPDPWITGILSECTGPFDKADLRAPYVTQPTALKLIQ
jgi:hypothetical protein